MWNASLRELHEECGLCLNEHVLPTGLHPSCSEFISTSNIIKDNESSSSIQFHYLIAHFFLTLKEGVLESVARAGSDAADVNWFTLTQIEDMERNGNIGGSLVSVIENFEHINSLKQKKLHL